MLKASHTQLHTTYHAVSISLKTAKLYSEDSCGMTKLDGYKLFSAPSFVILKVSHTQLQTTYHAVSISLNIAKLYAEDSYGMAKLDGN
jgi:hypothetical protein